MAFDGDRIPDVLDFSVGTDQESAADDAAENTAHELLGTPDTVSFDHFVAGIAEQRKIEFLLGLEFGESIFGIGAGAQYHHILLVEVLLCVAKLGRFGGSTGSVGFGKEKDDHAVVFEVLKRDFASGVGLQRKVRGLLSNFQHINSRVLRALYALLSAYSVSKQGIINLRRALSQEFF